MNLALSNPSARRGIALVIVLAFVVLISAAATAFFSYTAKMRHVSQSSARQAQADGLARSALAIVVGSLKEEIADASSAETSGTCTLYIPGSASAMLPCHGAAVAGTGNLIKVSSAAQAGADPFLASNALTTATSANGRSISAARWNRHYLLARQSTGAQVTDATPESSFTPPAWVYVTDRGPKVLVSPTTSAIGRYAYAVYDEGGLLDMNVAGFPSAVTTALPTRKGPLAFAILKCLVSTGSMADNIVGWRNYATAEASGTSIRYLHFGSEGADAYCDNVVSPTNGFMTVSGKTRDGRTDQVFLSRQELLQYRNELKFSVNALAHMGTFSRAVTAPAHFHGVRFAAGGTLSHYGDDGTLSSVAVSAGLPLLQSRFSLRRLAWVPLPGAAAANPEALHACFGILETTSVSGTLQTSYVGSVGNTPQGIETLEEVAAENPPREPNFFELLKAGISAKSGSSTPSDAEIIRTGLDIIGKYQSNEDTEGRSPLFQSVGGLGYAVDFWDGTWDYAPLLDVFAATDEPRVAAGRINPNRPDSTAFYAILSNSALNEAGGATLSDSKTLTIAVALQTALPSNPMLDNSGWVATLANVAGLSADEKRSALVALASVSNPRTWNLLIDVVAQVGVFPKNAASLDGFEVQSERRFWLHVAIDRYTGKVVDRQLEAVYE